MNRPPATAQEWNTLGIELGKQNRLADAVEAFSRAVEIDASFAPALHNLGLAFNKLDRPSDAERMFRDAINANESHVDSHYELALLLKKLNRVDEAIHSLEETLQLKPDHVEARGVLALLLLLNGDYPRGWAEYEIRWQCPSFPERPRFESQRWKGEPLDGKTILIYAEQGLGDTIQFIRYAPLVSQCGGHVIVECPEPLYSLVQTVQGVERVIVKGHKLPPFDVACPLMSLPALFGTTLQSIPNHIPYVSVSQKLRDEWSKRIAPHAGKFNVGLCWTGGAKHKSDRQRSCSLQTFAALAEIPGVTFFSLQKGPAAAEAIKPPGGMKIVNLTAALSDLSDTAALIHHLDLVISVDTAVAHLTGALGKPGWILLPFAPDFRWLLDRQDSPWYPTLQLFRQDRLGDWQEPISKLKASLQHLASTL